MWWEEWEGTDPFHLIRISRAGGAGKCKTEPHKAAPVTHISEGRESKLAGKWLSSQEGKGFLESKSAQRLPLEIRKRVVDKRRTNPVASEDLIPRKGATAGTGHAQGPEATGSGTRPSAYERASRNPQCNNQTETALSPRNHGNTHHSASVWSIKQSTYFDTLFYSESILSEWVRDQSTKRCLQKDVHQRCHKLYRYLQIVIGPANALKLSKGSLGNRERNILFQKSDRYDYGRKQVGFNTYYLIYIDNLFFRKIRFLRTTEYSNQNID